MFHANYRELTVNCHLCQTKKQAPRGVLLRRLLTKPQSVIRRLDAKKSCVDYLTIIRLPFLM